MKIIAKPKENPIILVNFNANHKDKWYIHWKSMQNLKKQSFLLKLRVLEEMSIPHRELAIDTSNSEVTIRIIIDS